MMSHGRVAVVGAGALGLMAMKILIEDGFDVKGYESRDYVGGLWKSSSDSSLSITENTTIFNTSKYRAAISDFPFPLDTDDFPTAEQIYRYLEAYCDAFNLRSRIELKTTVIGIHRQTGDGALWAVESVRKGPNSRPTTAYFDKVLIATGSFTSPRTPALEGIRHFQGPILHSMNFQHASQYKHKTVLLIGLHATAQDITVALSKYASKVYISHKRGVVMLPRYSSNGATSDQSSTVASLIFQTFAGTWFPGLFNCITDRSLESTSKKVFPVPSEWHFFPAPSNAITGPLVADQIYSLFMSGFAEPVRAVRRILGPKAVEMADERILDDIDAIIFCTGYNTDVPFLGEHNPYSIVGEPPYLYRNIFPIHPDDVVRNSLAFLGHAVIPFSGFALYELNAMCVSQVWVGNSQLPSRQKMERWHRARLAWRQDLIARQKVKGTTFYATMLPPGDHIKWLDDTAGTGIFENLGWFRRGSWMLWWNERQLYIKCKYGLFSPAIWRLFSMGKRKPWDGAKEQIWIDNDFAEREAKRRLLKLSGTDGTAN